MAKILLVEDDKSLREIYGVRLMAEGYEIVSAGDGEEALAMAIKERPDLIVSDVMMPKISGFDMLDILRSTTETKDVKVIMMTALSSDDQRARGEALGADRYLVKSQVGIEDVVRTVHDVLGDVAAIAAPAMVFPPSPAPVQAPAAPAPLPANPVSAPLAPVAPVAPVAFAPLPVAPALVSAPFEVPSPAPVVEVAPAYATPEPAPAPAPLPTTPIEVAPVESMPLEPAPIAPVVIAPTPEPQPLPVFEPAPVQQPTPLPQPIAPFSTPAPASLGDRVIAPLSDLSATAPNVLDLSAQIEQALNGTGVSPTPPTA